MGYGRAMSIMEWVVGGFFLLVGLGTAIYVVVVVVKDGYDALTKRN
jgi:hypothetical protein